MNPEDLKDATPDSPITMITTYRQELSGQPFLIEGRRQVADQGQMFSPYPETFHCGVNIMVNGQPFLLQLTIPGDNIHDVFRILPKFLAQEVPKQAPLQIQAAQARARAQQPVIQRAGP